MKSKARYPLSRQIRLDVSIAAVAVGCGVAVFAAAILLQWLIYDDWLHRNGSVRIVGSALSAALTFFFAYRWQQSKRREKIGLLKRFERIRRMNDRIRNSLQAIECVVYATNPHVTDPVREAVDSIEDVLQEMLNETSYSVPVRAGDRTSSRSAPTST